jgi:hypothetical protein
VSLLQAEAICPGRHCWLRPSTTGLPALVLARRVSAQVVAGTSHWNSRPGDCGEPGEGVGGQKQLYLRDGE